MVARGQDSGVEQPLEPGLVLMEDSMVELHFVDQERLFDLDEKVQLHARELYDTIITLWRFGVITAQALENYGRSLGLAFAVPKERSSSFLL
jgi:hypothetical protein